MSDERKASGVVYMWLYENVCVCMRCGVSSKYLFRFHFQCGSESYVNKYTIYIN